MSKVPPGTAMSCFLVHERAGEGALPGWRRPVRGCALAAVGPIDSCPQSLPGDRSVEGTGLQAEGKFCAPHGHWPCLASLPEAEISGGFSRRDHPEPRAAGARSLCGGSCQTPAPSPPAGDTSPPCSRFSCCLRGGSPGRTAGSAAGFIHFMGDGGRRVYCRVYEGHEIICIR